MHNKTVDDYISSVKATPCRIPGLTDANTHVMDGTIFEQFEL